MRTFSFLFTFLAITGQVSAQITITNVFNAASRVVNGSIAQGALIAVTGKGVGTPDIEQATFPLPTTAGLGGVTMQIGAGGQSYDAVVVYTKPNEVGAILPSAVPVGPATVTVNNNGVTASKAINVIDAAFGIFTQKYGTANGLALAFNVGGDGSLTPNSITQSVMAGQDVIINGTGLGAIASDETQNGATDVPAADVHVYIGIQPATLVSAGRGTCCDGIDPAYQIPPGIAAWDVIRFTVPDGITGCYMPVIVQIGKTVSNFATISIDPGGAACVPVPSGIPLDLANKLANQTGMSYGEVGLGRSITQSINNRGVLVTNKVDGGSASFIRSDFPATPIPVQTNYPNNVCSVNGWPGANGPGSVDVNGNTVAIVPGKTIGLDAGTPIVVKGSNGSRNIVKRTVGPVFDYPGATFGDTTPGNYFDSGHYTISDASGGKDVGPFTGAIDVPAAHFVWTNIPDITKLIDRTQDLIIKWTGGTPGTQVVIAGSGLSNGVSTAFLCAAPVEAGQFPIPSYILLMMPPASLSPITSGLTVENAVSALFTAPGLDEGRVTYNDSYHVSLKFQ